MFEKFTENLFFKIGASAILTITITGCDSTKSDIKQYIKCGMAAEQLGKREASREISYKLGKYLEKNKVQGSAKEAMFLAAEVRDDLNLDNKNPNGEIFTLAKVYNSSKCLKIHEQEKISMPWMYYLLYFFI